MSIQSTGLGKEGRAQTAPVRCLNTDEAAARLGLATATLNKWRVTGGGPRYVKLGRRVVYRPEDLEAFLSGRACGATAEYA